MIPFLAAVLAATVFTVQDPRIDEDSGMVDLGSLTILTNDSGDAGRVFVLDDHGRTVGITDYGSQVDAEALAPANAGHVWVGDIGDNDRERRFVVVRKVPVGRGERTVQVPAYRLIYPDGTAHDAETLLRDPHSGRLFVVTKALFGGVVYAAPQRLDPGADNQLTSVGSINDFATDGAFLSDDQVLVRGYTDVGVYAYPGFRRLATYPLPAQRQGESISVGPGGRVRIGSEGVRQPVVQLRLFDAGTAVRAALAVGR
ncbi:hypothetical protein D9V37_15095 [Nocardioides mangrovicus]|uniref:Uncharacterized protein n=1 Tax=Nocardioides mangrovicus TaxID=2478913 RepID=A0A3L8NZH7_9ACTN|nr:hypothetical protein [Nocardioides mangrovicus]RLV47508.1 hypothetical protein D9V37_15095 [Nocardioides mangrovicus]